MSITHPHGLSCAVNRGIVLTTFLFSGCALLTLTFFNIFQPHLDCGRKAVVYGICLFTCSFFSYLYNARFFPAAVALIRKLDHAAIFLLIAGTYTPFLSANIRGPFGISLLYGVWALAFTGIILKLKLPPRYDRVFVGFYLLMGWIFLAALPDIIHHTAMFPLVFLGLGAVFYSVGALIFARDVGRWTDPIWHGFVFTAAALHFIAVFDLVA